MKRFIVIILLAPLCSLSQEIKSNEVDGFSGNRIIETSIVSLKSAYTKGLGMYLSSSGDHCLVNVVGYGNGLGLIRKADFVYFLMDDGLILTAQSIGDQPEDEGGLTKAYQHHYLIRIKELYDLQNKNPVLLRITTAQGNRDISLSKKNIKEIKKLAELFLKETRKPKTPS